jgi:hypothetical protein
LLVNDDTELAEVRSLVELALEIGEIELQPNPISSEQVS